MLSLRQSPPSGQGRKRLILQRRMYQRQRHGPAVRVIFRSDAHRRGMTLPALELPLECQGGAVSVFDSERHIISRSLLTERTRPTKRFHLALHEARRAAKGSIWPVHPTARPGPASDLETAVTDRVAEGDLPLHVCHDRPEPASGLPTGQSGS